MLQATWKQARGKRTACWLSWVGVWLLVLVACGGLLLGAEATQWRCGKGWLEYIDGYPVLHLKGTSYEMGRQHGTLLKDHIRANLHYLLHVRGEKATVALGPLKLSPRQLVERIIALQSKYVPQRYFRELDAMADAAGVPRDEARIANFIPELFHCSGFALMHSATKDGTLYHGRVLDYATDWGLQEHAVLIVAEPEGGIPFVNVTYAGFIGSVSGMNVREISIGEMGGGGLGHWEGMPMALLVREVLEQAETLDEAIALFRDRRRTCQYYYVIADGKTNRAVGMEAGWNTFTVLRPGEKHELLPSPVKDCVLLSAGRRYEELVRRVKAGYGRFTAESALRLMDRPVAMESNLHNVLFEPRSTRFWVANAGRHGEPAATQKYYRFQLTELLQRKPRADAKHFSPPPEQPATLELNNPFFAFDNGTGRGRLSPEEQARMLKELGYDGIGYTGTAGIPEMLAALDRHGLKMFSIYVGANVAEGARPYDPGLPEAIARLKGRKTAIWLFVRGGAPSSDECDDRAVEILRELADMAARSDLPVVLYPHTGLYVATTGDALRLVKKANRPNLGVSFNLCHFLKADDPAGLEPLLRKALPHLLLVSINGADDGPTHQMGWDRLIQTLDRGSYDVFGVLLTLRRLGYAGPIGLQCYAIKGEPRENLRRSMQAWRKFKSRMKTFSLAPPPKRPATSPKPGHDPAGQPQR